MVESSIGDVIFDFHIKTGDSLVAEVKFQCETSQERAQPVTAQKNKNFNFLNFALCQPFDVLINSPVRYMDDQITGNFKSCQDCTKEKVNKVE